MGHLTVEPATIGHVIRFALAKNWRPQPAEYRLLVGQVASGRVWAGVDEASEVVALAGIHVARHGAPGLAWLAVSEAARQSIVSLVRVIRRRLPVEAVKFGGVSCVIRDDNAAGQRLARVSGFCCTDRRAGFWRQWEWLG